MTPDELDRVLDQQKNKRSGDGALYVVALAIVALIFFIIYGGR